MTQTIAVISDTHCHKWNEVHPEIRETVATVDIAVHCGDLTRMDVVHGMRNTAKHAVIVHGNSDPMEIRKSLPYIETIEVEGNRIGIIHPAWGGPPFNFEELLEDFPESVDIILFGHLHEIVNEVRKKVLFINPGQGYSSFAVPASIALLSIEGKNIRTEFVKLSQLDTRCESSN